MIKIEKGIQIPYEGSTLRTPVSQALHEMEVGDSFFHDNVKEIYQKATKEKNRSGKKFTVRKEGEGARVWRVS